MTVLDTSPGVRGLAGPSFQVERLVETLGQVVVEVTNRPVDADTVETIHAAVDAFIESDGVPRFAAARVARRFHQFGVAQARAGLGAADLQAIFSHACTEVMGELSRALVSRSAGRNLRLRTKQYLESLSLHALAGFGDHELQVKRARDRKRASLVDGPTALNGDRAGLVRAVVAVHRELPREILDDPSLHHRASEFEVFLPETIDLDEFATRLTGPVVYGPLTTWPDLPKTTALLWRAAALARARNDARTMIPCDDLAADLIVSADPALSNLLVHKHLKELSGIHPSRRAFLAETLLRWLERGLPTNQLAREVGLPEQTVHNRMKTLRGMFGDALDDPSQRLELTIALRATVPGWLAEAS